MRNRQAWIKELYMYDYAISVTLNMAVHRFGLEVPELEFLGYGEVT